MTTSTAPAARGRAGAVLACLAVAGVVSALMQTLVLPLLPQFPGWLGVSVDDAQWIATSTMLAGAVGAPVLGWLGDRLGFRRMIVASLLLLAIGSVVSALALDLAWMIAGRTLQGFSTAVAGLSLALARVSMPPQRLPFAVGIVSGTLGIGTGLGVPLAGVVLELLPWRTVFWIAAALGVLAALAVRLVVPEARAASGRARFDLPGALGFSALLVLVLVPLSMLASWGLAPASIGMWVAALALGAWWVRRELRVRAPFVDLRLAATPRILASHVTALLVGIAFFLSFTGTVYLSQTPTVDGVGLGGGVLLTGLVQTPASLASIAAAPLATAIAARAGAKATVAWGTVAVAASSALRLLVLDDAIVVAALALLVSASASFTFAAMPLILMEAVPMHATGATNGLNVMMRQVGAASASVLAAVVLAATLSSAGGGTFTRATFTLLFGTGAVLAGIAAVVMLALLVPRRDRLAPPPPRPILPDPPASPASPTSPDSPLPTTERTAP
jgi:MFS family permease